MSTTPRAEEKRPSTPETVRRSPRSANEQDILREIIDLFRAEHPDEGVDALIRDIEENGGIYLTPEEEEILRNEAGDIPELPSDDTSMRF